MNAAAPAFDPAFDIAGVRRRFPALDLPHDDRLPRIYLDNPAGTQVPVGVLDAMRDVMIRSNANMGGWFRTTREATALSAEAHQAMADMYGASSPDEIVFGANMTTLTFVMARALAERFEPGDEMIITSMEHEGNNSPWRQMAADRGMVVRTWGFDRDRYELDLDELDSLIGPRTRFAALNHASNLLGTINPIGEACRRLSAAGAITYVDSVQYAPHGPIDVQALGCDFLVASAYKFYGPHQGVLYGRRALLETSPARFLRTVPDRIPDRWESGTQSLEGQVGTTAAVEYLADLGRAAGAAANASRTEAVHAGLRSMAAYEETLSARLIAGLQSLDGVTIRGITDPAAMSRRVPTVSITVEGVDPADLARYCDTRGIYLWSGHSYALPVVEWLGIADRGGVLRIGPTHYNTVDEIDAVVAAIGEYLAGR